MLYIRRRHVSASHGGRRECDKKRSAPEPSICLSNMTIKQHQRIRRATTLRSSSTEQNLRANMGAIRRFRHRERSTPHSLPSHSAICARTSSGLTFEFQWAALGGDPMLLRHSRSRWGGITDRDMTVCGFRTLKRRIGGNFDDSVETGMFVPTEGVQCHRLERC